MAWRGSSVWDPSALFQLGSGQTFDRWFPFLPWTITLYATLGFWYFVPAVTVAPARERELAALYRAMLLMCGAAVVFFLLLPTEIRLRDQAQAVLSGPGVSSWWRLCYGILYIVDRPYNSWPCLHTAQPLLIQLALASWHGRKHRLAVAAGWVWWGLLTVSILTTKQHYLWDVLTGVLLAIVTWYAYLRSRLATPRPRSDERPRPCGDRTW
jgi:membrane-associated phospholipid phosphatase